MTLVHAQTFKWNVKDYLRLSDLGFLPADAKVELIDGAIVHMAAQKTPHGGAILRSNKVLVLAFHETHDVGVQITNLLTEFSAPEPDFAIFPNGQVGPGDPLRGGDLIMEVADSSLAYDRCEKASLYASAGVRDYWILNVQDRCSEVHREPAMDATAPFGASYRSITLIPESGTVTPLCRPDLRLRVADLL